MRRGGAPAFIFIAFVTLNFQIYPIIPCYPFHEIRQQLRNFLTFYLTEIVTESMTNQELIFSSVDLSTLVAVKKKSSETLSSFYAF